MAVEPLLPNVIIDGEFIIDPGVLDPWVGGQPAFLGAAGVSLLKAGGAGAARTSLRTIGLFKNMRAAEQTQEVQVNDAATATVQAPNNASVVLGPGKVRLFTNGQDAAPFRFPPTGGGGVWTAGDEIFASNSVIAPATVPDYLLDNTPGVAADVAFGRVLRAPLSATDDMIVYLYPPRTANV